jgi:radical SAM protein with 4Fe4S-binding SPASM domain
MSLMGRLARRVLNAPTYARTSHAFFSILAHSTPRRLWNLALVEAEFRLRRTRVAGRPYVLVIDPTNVCNLRCPLCPTGLMQRGRKAGMIPWETFVGVIDAAAPWAYKVNLFNWGEPLLHTHLFDMVRYAKSRNLGTSLSSNMSIALSDERIDELIGSGLEYLCLSIDGATQEAYARYRRRGDLELVLANVRRLVKRRRELGSRTPVLEWQFIPMKHNEHELDAARALAAEIGVDVFRCIPVGLPFDSTDTETLAARWFPTQSGNGVDMSSNDQADSSCYFLYRYLVVNPDGRTSPCCVVSGEQNDFGNLGTESLGALWNNAMYRSGRSLYRAGAKVESPTVCERCDLFAKRSARATAVPGSRPAPRIPVVEVHGTAARSTSGDPQ